MPNVISLRPPSYRRHKPSGQAVVTLNGRDIAEYLLSGHARAVSAASELTVAEVMAAYLGHAAVYYRKAGQLTREYGLIVDCCRVMRPLYGRSPAVEFGPLALKAVRPAMIEADHSRKYINKNIERIRRMFKWAAAEDLLPASIPQALSMVAGLRRGRTEARETSPVLPVSDAVVEATLPKLPEIVADMVHPQRLTGARPEEICLLRPQDLDHSGAVWQYRPQSHKTEHHDKRRVIYVGPKGQEILRPYPTRASDDYCFCPSESEAKRRAARAAARKTAQSCGNKPGSNRVATPRRVAGRHYSTASYRRAIHRGCDAAFPHPTLGAAVVTKMPQAERKELRDWRRAQRWSPNQLRHAAATDVRRDFGLEAA